MLNFSSCRRTRHLLCKSSKSEPQRLPLGKQLHASCTFHENCPWIQFWRIGFLQDLSLRHACRYLAFDPDSRKDPGCSHILLREGLWRLRGRAKLLEWTAGCQTRSRFDREETNETLLGAPWTRLEPNEAYRYLGTLLGVAANILAVGDVSYQVGKETGEGAETIKDLILSLNVER